MRVSDLTVEVVLPLLRGRLGKPYRHLPECTSTQRLFADDAPEGATVTTDHQTEGRGRLGRTWEDAPGRALLCSIVLRPPRPISDWPQLSLVAGAAVAAALPLAASVLAPNDVFVGERKVAGILPEAADGRVVLGIGVNVNQTPGELPPDARKPATSLRIELGRELERAPLLAAILSELERRYSAWCDVS
jgi:BirA family transcriptional regulator, biotin operon repressor / biotin---[acetyl-CoA-carboxylase] ligase